MLIVSPPSQVQGQREEEWQGVRKYLDPNPHLKGVDIGRDAPKVSRPEYFQFRVELESLRCMSAPFPYNAKVSFGCIVQLVYPKKALGQ